MKKIYIIILLTLSVTFAKATVHTVSVLSSSFSPSVVNAVCGDTVLWVLVSGVHTTTSTSVPSCATSWDAPLNSNTPVFAIVVSCAGTFNYMCTPHGFTGVINATCTVGISDVNAGSYSPWVYPNPSINGMFNVSFGKTENPAKRMYVMDTDGKKIIDVRAIHESPLQSPLQSSAAINHIINLQSCASGIYFLVLEPACHSGSPAAMAGRNEKGRRVYKLVR